MSYNLSQVTVNGSDMLHFTQGINSVFLYGFLGNFFLMMIALIFFMSFYRSTENVSKSIAATSFICFILSLLLKAVNLVDNITIYITLILTACTLAFLWKE